MFSILSAARLWGNKKPSEAPDSLATLEHRIRTILPEEYQDTYESVEPVSMGSAGLKYGPDGKVAWNDIWDTFCDLAMAGGPPHKGHLLQTASPEEIAADPLRYNQVVDEICRGVRMVTSLAVMPSPHPGWVRVDCETPVSANWLVRAIVMENISARSHDTMLDLPAGPAYRIEKEMKNVVTVMAKTGHYWLDHTGPEQQQEIGDLFARMERESPLIQPAVPNQDLDPEKDQRLRQLIASALKESPGLSSINDATPGWLGLQMESIPAAIWMMRALVASNVLSRREDTVLFVPLNPTTDPEGETVIQITRRIHGFAQNRRHPAK